MAGAIWSALKLKRYVFFFVCAPVDVLLKLKCYLTLLRHVQAATVDRQIKLQEILEQWRVGDVLLCYSPDR